MRTPGVALALAVITFALGSCASSSTSSSTQTGATSEHSMTIEGGAVASAGPETLSSPSYWRLIELRGRPLDPRPQDERAAFLVFEKGGDRIHGFAGCNDFSGNCEYMDGNRLRISDVAVTRKACADMTVESEFLNVMESADNYFTDGKVLKLHRARMAPLAVFEAASGEPK